MQGPPGVRPRRWRIRSSLAARPLKYFCSPSLLRQERRNHLIEGSRVFSQPVGVDKETGHDERVGMVLFTGFIAGAPTGAGVPLVPARSLTQHVIATLISEHQ